MRTATKKVSRLRTSTSKKSQPVKTIYGNLERWWAVGALLLGLSAVGAALCLTNYTTMGVGALVVAVLVSMHHARYAAAGPLMRLHKLVGDPAAPGPTAAHPQAHQVANVLMQQRQRTARATAFVEAIGRGELDTAAANLGETNGEGQDALAEALQRMQQQMQTMADQERARNWVVEGLAQFVELLRMQNLSVTELSDQLLAKLTRYVGANQAALFIASDEENNEVLDMVACYAYDRKKHLHKQVQPGEGLLGQAFLEAETICLTEVPTHYVQITSGLGEAPPTCLLIVPLRLNDVCFGLIELAFFQVAAPHQIEFLERLGESIAATMANVRTSERTRLLLEASQQQSEELRAQEEEMRQNMEELSATQEEMMRKQHELERYQEELQQKHEEVEQTRRTERERAEAKIDAQKKAMQQVMERMKAREGELQQQLAACQAEMAALKSN